MKYLRIFLLEMTIITSMNNFLELEYRMKYIKIFFVIKNTTNGKSYVLVNKLFLLLK